MLTALLLAHLLPQPTFDLIRQEFSGSRAKEQVRKVVEHHRIQGSPMMAEAAESVILRGLKEAGVDAKLERFPSDGKTLYGTYISPLGWQIRKGELWVTGVAGDKAFAPVRLCRYADVPMCVTTYSRGGEFNGALVDVGRGTDDADYAGKDVRGKVALASGYAANVIRLAVLKHGAVGVVIYPAPTDRMEHPDLVRYNGAWTRASEVDTTAGGFQISARDYARLTAWMKKGAVTVRGTIDATLKQGELTVVNASIRGAERPEEEVLITAHLDHPKWSANDNASGAGAALELARSLQALIAAKKLPSPRRTLRFLWVPEFFGTLAWVVGHPELTRCGAAWDDPRPRPAKRGPCLVANINLDMVGEDTVATNSRFYATRTPDSVPGTLDALLADVMAQTEEARIVDPVGAAYTWSPHLVEYAQGSDHDVFLGLGVPSTMVGHDPDWTHHSSADTIDKVDPTELARSGVFAGAAAWFLAAASDADRARLERAAVADRLSRWSARVARTVDPARRARAEQQVVALAAALTGKAPPAEAPPAAKAAGPRRAVLLPFDDTAFERLTGDDAVWWKAQGDALEDRDVQVFEAVNLMDGRRTTAEIAQALSDAFDVEVSTAWVDRLVALLSAAGYVRR